MKITTIRKGTTFDNLNLYDIFVWQSAYSSAELVYMKVGGLLAYSFNNKTVVDFLREAVVLPASIEEMTVKF